jgi:predicted permease
LFTCLIFGLPPALHATQPPRTAGIRMPMRALFLSVQVALCVVLLVSAGLLVRGVQHASSENEGFAVNAVTSLSFDFRSQQIAAERTKPFVNQLTYALRSLPKATTVGLSTGIPLSSTGKSDVRLPGEEESRSQDIVIDQVTDEYFGVLGIPRVAGVSFTAEHAGRGTIIVNETLARVYGDASAIVGKTVLLGGVPVRVIGVVKDFRASSLERVEPTAYEPFTGDGMANVLVRNDAPGAAAAMAALARRIDPGVSVTITPLSIFLDRRLAPSRTLARVSGVLGVLALVMATIGVFGVFAFVVQQRTQEIGIRMALGARAAEVVRLVLKSSARAIGAGLFVGFIAAFIASRMLGANLYGLSPLDPATYLSVALVLLSAGLAAAYWPARRATRIAPATALRIE